MKGFIIFLLSIAIIGIIVVAIFGTGPASQNEESASMPVVITQTVEENTDQYSVDATYPQIKSLKEKSKEEEINQRLEEDSANAIAQFKEDASQVSSSSLAISAKSTYYSRFHPAVITNNLITIWYENATYNAGAAHPLSFDTTFNYDIKNNRPVTLSALFIPGAPYLALVSDYAIQDLLRQFSEEERAALESSIREGAGPSPENFSTFLLTAPGLKIFFNPYQVAPYAAGIREVVVPWQTLATILDPVGPAASLAVASSTTLR